MLSQTNDKMWVKFISGDILNMNNVDAIIHQVNCLCITPYGLSEQLSHHCSWSLSTQIAKTMPWGDIYSTRRGDSGTNLANKEDRGRPGSIRVFKSPGNLRPDVICFLSQWDFGTVEKKYRHIPPFTETKETRLHWFCQCLQQMHLLEVKSVGIKNNFGGGLAKEDLVRYKTEIESFSKKSGIDFYIISPKIPYFE